MVGSLRAQRKKTTVPARFITLCFSKEIVSALRQVSRFTAIIGWAPFTSCFSCEFIERILHTFTPSHPPARALPKKINKLKSQKGESFQVWSVLSQVNLDCYRMVSLLMCISPLRIYFILSSRNATRCPPGNWCTSYDASGGWSSRGASKLWRCVPSTTSSGIWWWQSTAISSSPPHATPITYHTCSGKARKSTLLMP